MTVFSQLWWRIAVDLAVLATTLYLLLLWAKEARFAHPFGNRQSAQRGPFRPTFGTDCHGSGPGGGGHSPRVPVIILFQTELRRTLFSSRATGSRRLKSFCADAPKTFGTRWLAAMGIAERSDAAVIVVSEEDGKVQVRRLVTSHIRLKVTTADRRRYSGAFLFLRLPSSGVLSYQ